MQQLFVATMTVQLQKLHDESSVDVTRKVIRQWQCITMHRAFKKWQVRGRQPRRQDRRVWEGTEDGHPLAHALTPSLTLPPLSFFLGYARVCGGRARARELEEYTGWMRGGQARPGNVGSRSLAALYRLDVRRLCHA